MGCLPGRSTLPRSVAMSGAVDCGLQSGQNRRQPQAACERPNSRPPISKATPTTSRPPSTTRCKAATSTSSWPAGPTRTTSSASTRAARAWSAPSRSAPPSRPCSATAASGPGRSARARSQAVASAVHNVLERVEVLGPDGPAQAWVIATNVYHKTAQGWRMVAHHASPGTASDIQEVSGGPAGAALNYAAPWWLPGGNLQTIWPALSARRALRAAAALPARALDHARRRLRRPGLARADDATGSRRARPLLVLFHGLEGSSRSHYAEAFADFARERGLAFVVPHFRGCSGELNPGPRAYHSGDHEEIGWILAPLARAPARAAAGRRRVAGRQCPAALGRRDGRGGGAGLPMPWLRSARRSTWRPGSQAIGRGFNRLVVHRGCSCAA